jgi:chromosome segregation ATPase
MEMSLANDVEVLEDNYEELKQECRSLEESLSEVEGELEDMINQRDRLQAFYTWVELAYPVVVKDYQSVKLIEEIAHEHG